MREDLPTTHGVGQHCWTMASPAIDNLPDLHAEAERVATEVGANDQLLRSCRARAELSLSDASVQ